MMAGDLLFMSNICLSYYGEAAALQRSQFEYVSQPKSIWWFYVLSSSTGASLKQIDTLSGHHGGDTRE